LEGRKSTTLEDRRDKGGGLSVKHLPKNLFQSSTKKIQLFGIAIHKKSNFLGFDSIKKHLLGFIMS
jgi:hypothetical protein